VRADRPTSAFDRSAYETSVTSSSLAEHATAAFLATSFFAGICIDKEVQMTDVLAPVFIPYARFLEVRARRLDIATETPKSNGQCVDDATVSSGPTAGNDEADVALNRER
jgi:hypothetical protein